MMADTTSENRIEIDRNEKTEFGDSVFLGSAPNGSTDLPSILAAPPNFDNTYGAVMFNESDTYVQLRRSHEFDELVEHHPLAFVLLSVIARRAKRTDEFSALLLEPGEALIGDYKKYGLTRQQYRTSLQKLLLYRFITIRATNRGTIARLCDTRVYDINIQKNDHQATNNSTKQQPSSNHQATTNNNVNKDKNKNKKTKQKKAAPSDVATSLLVVFNNSLKKYVPEVATLPESSSATHFDALLNDYSPDEIQAVIHFCHTGWWAKVVHSPSYLRYKFSKLLAAMRRDEQPAKRPSRAHRNADGSIANPELRNAF